LSIYFIIGFSQFDSAKQVLNLKTKEDYDSQNSSYFAFKATISFKDYPRTIMRQLTRKMRKFRDKYAIWIIYIPWKSSDFSVTVQDIDRTTLLKKNVF
jgi:hypothetical protein